MTQSTQDALRQLIAAFAAPEQQAAMLALITPPAKAAKVKTPKPPTWAMAFHTMGATSARLGALKPVIHVADGRATAQAPLSENRQTLSWPVCADIPAGAYSLSTLTRLRKPADPLPCQPEDFPAVALLPHDSAYPVEATAADGAPVASLSLTAAALAQLVQAMSTEPSRPYICGITVDASAKLAVATDWHILLRQAIECTGTAVHVMPDDFIHAMRKANQSVFAVEIFAAAAGSRNVIRTTLPGDVILESFTVDCTPVGYDRVVPDAEHSPTRRYNFSAAAIRDLNKKTVVRLYEDGQWSISDKSDGPRLSATVGCPAEDSEIRPVAGFAGHLLKQALHADGSCVLRIRDETSPGLFDLDAPGMLPAVIMPMRV